MIKDVEPRWHDCIDTLDVAIAVIVSIICCALYLTNSF